MEFYRENDENQKRWHLKQQLCYVDVNNQQALMFVDHNGMIRSRQDFYEIAEMAMRFYDRPGVDEWIYRKNRLTPWSSHYLFGTEMVDGKLLLPTPRYEEKPFKKNLKRNWSFQCGWCERKVSSAVEETYFLINLSLTPKDYFQERCCQPACADNLWYDKIANWVLEEELDDIIHTDKNKKA